MTTVIGLANEELSIAFLAADRQGTLSHNGNPIGKDLQRRKLWTSSDDMFVVGHSGFFNDSTYELVQNLISGKIDLEKVLSEGKFPDLRELNINQMGTKIPSLENTSSFLLATRYSQKPKVYTCWPLGDVEERGVTWIGSGSSKVEEYFKALNTLNEAKNYLSGSKANQRDMIRFGLEAVRHAQEKDLYSSGLDMVVLTPRKTNDHYDILTDDFAKRLSKVQSFYRNRSKK